MGLHEFANPAFVSQLISGIEVSDSLLLIAAITIQPPILMIVLSRALPNKINWIVNIAVAVFAIGLEISNVAFNSPDLDNKFFFGVEFLSYFSIICISVYWRLKLIRERNQ